MRITQILDYETFRESLFEIADNTAKYADRFWLRIKNEDGSKVYEYAKKLKTFFPDKFLILSERADIALACGFDAVQLGFKTLSPVIIKNSFPDLKVGYSAHSTNELCTMGADFYTISPVFHTEKPYEVNPLGNIDCSDYSCEIHALGGITSENVLLLKDKGYSGVSGIGFHSQVNKIYESLSQ